MFKQQPTSFCSCSINESRSAMSLLSTALNKVPDDVIPAAIANS